MKISQPLYINKSKCKNRIVMPPLVCFNWADDKGYETVDRALHYGQRSATGLIVLEATAISPEGRLCDSQLGLWEDGHIAQFERMADACHDDQALVIVQLVHAGFKGITETLYSASADTLEGKKVKALTLDQIETIKNDFVKAALRAHQAGLDGVEIHGAHTYLLNQFTSAKTNHRCDQYGGNLENRHRLPIEIVEAVRSATSENFIIGYRFGVNDETFQEDIALIKALDQSSVDFFDVSIGFASTNVQVPEGFKYHPITYMGIKLQEYTNKPVACVYGIKDPLDAENILKDYKVAMVAVGKGLLADPLWTKKALLSENVDLCIDCQPRCKFGIDGHKCPRALMRNKMTSFS